MFKSSNTIRQTLMKVNTPQRPTKKVEVVYKIPCLHCDQVYIGGTRRNLHRRITEHKMAVKRGDRSNDLAVHASDAHYQIDWEKAKVKKVEKHKWKRNSNTYSKTQELPNWTSGLVIHDSWLPFVGTNNNNNSHHTNCHYICILTVNFSPIVIHDIILHHFITPPIKLFI